VYKGSGWNFGPESSPGSCEGQSTDFRRSWEARSTPISQYRTLDSRRVGATGYEIHHGRVVGDADRSVDGRVRGTSVHGLLEDDAVRSTLLVGVAQRRGKRFVPAGVSFAAARTARFDALADAIESHLDMAAVERLIELGRPV
jgi:cobyric acid synthase